MDEIEDKIASLKKMAFEHVFEQHPEWTTLYPPLTKEELSKIKVGDKVKRAIPGTPSDEFIVINVQPGVITINKVVPTHSLDGWTFSSETGYEIEERFGWDGSKPITYLTKK